MLRPFPYPLQNPLFFIQHACRLDIRYRGNRKLLASVVAAQSIPALQIALLCRIMAFISKADVATVAAQARLPSEPVAHQRCRVSGARG